MSQKSGFGMFVLGALTAVVVVKWPKIKESVSEIIGELMLGDLDPAPDIDHPHFERHPISQTDGGAEVDGHEDYHSDDEPPGNDSLKDKPPQGHF